MSNESKKVSNKLRLRFKLEQGIFQDIIPLHLESLNLK